MREVSSRYVFPCEQFHAGVSAWLNEFSATTKHSSFQHAYQNSWQNRFPIRSAFHLKQELSVKTLWHDTKMMVSPTKLDSPFCQRQYQNSQSASPSHLRIEKLEGDFAHLWKALSSKLQEIFPERDAKDTFIVRCT